MFRNGGFRLPCMTELDTTQAQPLTQSAGTDDTIYVVWLDGEMTGFNYRDDLILEVACQVTTEADPLTILDSWNSLVTGWVRPWPTDIHPIAQQMHTDNGLFAAIKQYRGLYREQVVADRLERFIARWPGARLGGDGQHFDWRWICHQWGDRIFVPLHYRQIDVSQLHQNFKANAPSHVYESDPAVKDLHRAVSDVEQSRLMYAHYRAKIRMLEGDGS